MTHRISILIFIVFVGISLRCININSPWTGFHESAGPQIGNFVRNSLRYGLIETKFATIKDSGPVLDGNYSYYMNHPIALFIVLTAVSYKVFGIHEWSTRIVPVFFSIFPIVVLYWLVREIRNNKTALIAALFYSISPISVYNERIAWPFSLLTLFVLLTSYSYLRWSKTNLTKHFVMMLLFQAISLQFGWPAYYFAPLLLMHCFFYKRKKVGLMFIPVILNILFFGLHLFHMQLLNNEQVFSDIWSGFLLRTGQKAFEVSWLSYLGHVIMWNIKFFTLPLFLLSLLWLVSLFKTNERSECNQFAVIYLIFGCGNVFLLREATWDHQGMHYLYNLSPFFAISGALGLVYLYDIVISKFSNEDQSRKMFYLMAIIAASACLVILIYQTMMGNYSWRFFMLVLVFGITIMGLLVFAQRTNVSFIKYLLRAVHPLYITFFIIFLAQSSVTTYKLYRIKGYAFDYAFAKSINQNTEFEDAIVTSLNPLYYWIPYYSDRFIVQEVHTKDNFMDILKEDNKRKYKYYVTTNTELMKKAYYNAKELSPGQVQYLRAKGVDNQTSDLEQYLYDNYSHKIKDFLIFFDLENKELTKGLDKVTY